MNNEPRYIQYKSNTEISNRDKMLQLYKECPIPRMNYCLTWGYLLNDRI